MADNISVSSTLSNASVLSFDFNAQDIHLSCPEKIVLCIDISKDVITTTVNSRDRSHLPLLTVWKNALTQFVYNKSMLGSYHEFALMILTDTANWFCDFNSDPQLVAEALVTLEAIEQSFESFDTSSIFSTIYENCPPPSCPSGPTPPPYVVRAIVLYGRSNCLPVYRGESEAYSELIASPHFFLDVLYSHDPPTGRNNSQNFVRYLNGCILINSVVNSFVDVLAKSIFDILSETYPKPKALVLDWSSNIVKLYNCFAKLLAHPLQRPVQTLMDNRLLMGKT